VSWCRSTFLFCWITVHLRHSFKWIFTWLVLYKLVYFICSLSSTECYAAYRFINCLPNSIILPVYKAGIVLGGVHSSIIHSVNLCMSVCQLKNWKTTYQKLIWFASFIACLRNPWNAWIQFWKFSAFFESAWKRIRSLKMLEKSLNFTNQFWKLDVKITDL